MSNDQDRNNVINFIEYRMRALESRLVLDGEALGEFVSNTAPTIDISNDIEFDPIVEDINPNLNVGNTVTEIINQLANYQDPNPGDQKGIAITQLGNEDIGQWQFSLDNGMTWSQFSMVSEDCAVLLNGDARIRFLPDPNQHGQAVMQFRAWDQTVGINGQMNIDTTSNGGNTAFSTQIETASIDIIEVNDSPDFAANDNVTLQTIRNGDDIQGDLVQDVFASLFIDIDNPFAGVAIVSSDNSKDDGAWLFSIDGGQTYQNFGTLSDESAVILRPTDLIAYSPTTFFEGTPGPVQARLFDGSQTFPTGQNIDITSEIGFGGAFSNSVRDVNITVLPLLTEFFSSTSANQDLSQEISDKLFENNLSDNNQTIQRFLQYRSLGKDGDVAEVTTQYQYDFSQLEEEDKKKEKTEEGEGSFEDYPVDKDYLPEEQPQNNESNATEEDKLEDAEPEAEKEQEDSLLTPLGHQSLTQQIDAILNENIFQLALFEKKFKKLFKS